MKHVSGRKYTAADGFSKRPTAAHEIEDLEDINNFITAKLNSIRINSIALDTSIFPLHDGYFEKSVQIASYFTIFKKFTGMTLKKFNQFKKNTMLQSSGLSLFLPQQQKRLTALCDRQSG